MKFYEEAYTSLAQLDQFRADLAEKEAIVRASRNPELQLTEMADMILANLIGGVTLAWKRQASCLGLDPDLFYPEKGNASPEAKEVCRTCVVREDCLEFGLVNGEKFGVWGGKSARELRLIRRRRRFGSETKNSTDEEVAS